MSEQIKSVERNIHRDPLVSKALGAAKDIKSQRYHPAFRSLGEGGETGKGKAGRLPVSRVTEHLEFQGERFYSTVEQTRSPMECGYTYSGLIRVISLGARLAE